MGFRVEQRDDQFWWVYRALNGRVIADSGEGFATRAGAHDGAALMAEKAATWRFEVVRSGRRFAWRAVADNGELVAASPRRYRSDARARRAAATAQSRMAKEGKKVATESSSETKTNEVGAWLAGGLALVGTAIGVVGLADADLDRALVNHEVWMFVGFVLVLAGVLGGVWAALPGFSRIGLLAALVAYGFGVGIIVWASADAKSASDRPQVEAVLSQTDSGLRLKGTVHAATLQVNEHVFVRVLGISTSDRLAGAHIGHPRATEVEFADRQPQYRQLLYSSRTGASADGTAQVSFDIAVGQGLYERLDVEALISDDDRKHVEVSEFTRVCDRERKDIGCESIMVPPATAGPRLAATWKTAAKSPAILSVKAAMGDLSADDRVILVARRVKKGKLGPRVYAAAWAPDAKGEVAETVDVPVAARHQGMCVTLRPVPAATATAAAKTEHFGPCKPRAGGMAVLLAAPPNDP